MNSPSTYIIEDIEGFKELERHFSNVKQSPVFFDLETDSVVEKKANIHGIGICVDTKEAFYIPIRNQDKQLLWDTDALSYIFNTLSKFLSYNKVVGHNVIYDCLVWENNTGTDISSYVYADTILMKHTVDEDRPFGLKEVAVKYLGPWADKAQKAMLDSVAKNGGCTTKDNLEMYKCSIDILAEYCCWDVYLTARLYELFSIQLKEQGLEKLFYEEEIMPLYKEVVIPMKRKGFPIDVKYFEQLKTELKEEIGKLEDSIHKEMEVPFTWYSNMTLDKDYPVSRTGGYPKALAAHYSLSLPEVKGKPTLAKKAVLKANEDAPHFVWRWVLGESCVLESTLKMVQREMFFKDNPEDRYVFNLNSTSHLKWLFFKHLGCKPLSKTEGGEPQVDDDFLKSVEKRHKFVTMLIDFKKLNKLLSTYVEGVLERQVDGVIYTSYLQFGTTSGRFSSTNPNLQNIPRVKDEDADLSPLVLKYVNGIKRGFIPPSGHKIIGADFSQLEVVCFAHVSEEDALRAVIRNGEDVYSKVAIQVNGLEKQYSADKKSDNFLKKYKPELRQLWKVPTLGIVYGMEENRLKESIGCSFQEAGDIIKGYLETYPNLKKYMDRCDKEARELGRVSTQFGRVRHLPNAKRLWEKYGVNLLDRKWARDNGLSDQRYLLKNACNNAKNFKIQGLAAHILNRSMIEIAREIKRQKLTASIVSTTHDEVGCIAPIHEVDAVKRIIQDKMENTVRLSVPLRAVPMVGDNWASAK